MKAVLVPLDGSKNAQHALEYAVRVAKAGGASLDIVSIVYPFGILGRTPVEPLEEEHIAKAKAEADRVVREAVAFSRAEGVAANGDVELGEPAAAIVARAQRARADEIVMGTHGRSGFKRLSMGGIAQQVLRSSPCAVVIVREPAAIVRERAAAEATAAAVSFDASEPVVVMRLIEVKPDDFERLYGEIASFMSGPGRELGGMVETELFGSEDLRRIAIVAEFRSREDWARAQWDATLGDLLEEIAGNSKTLEFNLYRHDRFPAAPAAVLQ